MDFTAERVAMIDSQVRPNDVTDRRLIAAMAATPREAFVPADKRALAYVEQVVQTGPGRALWMARDFAKLVHSAGIGEDDTVLDIAPGSGYSTAVLAKLAGKVVALEQDEAAAAPLRALGLRNVEVLAGVLASGAASKAPFAAIFVNGAVDEVPKAWLDQLAEGGRLAVAINEGAVRRGCVYTRSGSQTSVRNIFDSAVPILPGFEKVAAFRL
jgi:protein-L-isoaspartate(D-aspartate) O-methyltransferase